MYSSLESENEIIYPDITAEIPVVVPESDFKDDKLSILFTKPPTLAEMVSVARINANFSETTGVGKRKITGVHRKTTGVRRYQLGTCINNQSSPLRHTMAAFEVEDINTDSDDDNNSLIGTPFPLIARTHEDSDSDDENDDKDNLIVE